jgi:hypothetical protein
MEFFRKNTSLILGVLIPVFMILAVAVSIYLPRLFVRPQTNFLYSIGYDAYFDGSKQTYVVKNGYLTQNYINPASDGNYYPPDSEPKLYYYDVTENASHQITFSQAARFRLSVQDFSPDGFVITQGETSDGNFFPFILSSSYSMERYLKGHGVTRKINLYPGSSYYDFHFLGWIIN